MAKKKPRPRTVKPDSEEGQISLVKRLDRALREYERNGRVADPELAARIRAGWNPGIEMAIMTMRPDINDVVKSVLLKALLDAEIRAAEISARSFQGDTSIQVLIAPWAAGPGGAPRLAAPARTVEAEVVRDAEEVAHSGMNSSPAPVLSEHEKMREQLRH